MTTAGAVYRVGIVLLDLHEPWKVLRRSDEWVLGPQAMYERVGDVGDVVFPTGAVVDEKTKELHLYYGAADCSVAVASANLDDIMDYVMTCPEGES
jgi:predicted GH43/DUF377 family glycosyl hydrolase